MCRQVSHEACIDGQCCQVWRALRAALSEAKQNRSEVDREGSGLTEDQTPLGNLSWEPDGRGKKQLAK